MQAVPHKPSLIVQRGEHTSQTQLHLTISELVQGVSDGGSPVTSYVIEWDAGDSNNAFSAIVGEASPNLDLSHYVYDNISSGTSYQFRYYAVNVHGPGPVSDTQVIQAANNPARMEAPTVTLEPGLLYKVSFTAPHSGGLGIAIEEYEIVFRRKDLTFATIAQCDGTSQTVIDDLACEVDLSLLVDPATFALELDDEVVVMARARNFNGVGLQSPESTNGALIVTKPEPPTQAPVRNHVDSTLTTIVIEMPQVESESTGGLEIISYSLQWNSGGTQETNWVALVGEAPDSTGQTFSVEGLVTATAYKFRYRVKNEVGWSDPSPIMLTYAGLETSQIQNTLTEIDPVDPLLVLFSWDEPADLGGLTLLSYRIEIRG